MSWKVRKISAAAAAALGAVSFLLPSLTWNASAESELAQACLKGDRFGDGGRTYLLNTTGKKKKLVITDGTFQGVFSVEQPSCLGATYSITVASANGQAINWNTTMTAPVGARTNVSSDGLTAVVEFAGDGITKTFSVEGTTSTYSARCVVTSAATAIGPVLADSSPPTEICGGTGGGGNYF